MRGMFEVHNNTELKSLGIVESEGLGKAPVDVYKFVADKFLDSLKTAKKNWVQEWAEVNAMPAMNLLTKKPYRGFINKLFTGIYTTPTQPYFLSKAQVEKKKGRIINEKKFAWIFFFKTVKSEKEIQNEDGTTSKTLNIYPMPRFYKVYHQSNIEGVNFPKVEPPKVYEHEQIETAEQIINSMPKRPKLTNDASNQAFYRPDIDIVNMPLLSSFRTPQSYYATFFHELVHSTKHAKRLGERKTQKHVRKKFGDEAYAYEELIAEIGAVFLCSDSGIMNFVFENSLAYTKGWLEGYVRMVKHNPKAIFNAVKEAQKAANYINKPNYNLLRDKYGLKEAVLAGPEQLVSEFISDFIKGVSLGSGAKQYQVLSRLKNENTHIRIISLCRPDQKRILQRIVSVLNKHVYRGMPTLRVTNLKAFSSLIK